MGPRRDARDLREVLAEVRVTAAAGDPVGALASLVDALRPLETAAADARVAALCDRLEVGPAEVRRELAALPDDAAREARVAELVAQVRELPRWFMKQELHSFDHIHPNMEGHRLMAETICPRLPASWGCDCGAIAAMDWLKKGGGVGPKVEQSAAAPEPAEDQLPN